MPFILNIYQHDKKDQERCRPHMLEQKERNVSVLLLRDRRDHPHVGALQSCSLEQILSVQFKDWRLSKVPPGSGLGLGLGWVSRILNQAT